MKVEVSGGETVKEPVFKSGIYVDVDNELWLFNDEEDGISLSESVYSAGRYEDILSDFGPLIYFTGTVTLTND